MPEVLLFPIIHMTVCVQPDSAICRVAAALQRLMRRLPAVRWRASNTAAAVSTHIHPAERTDGAVRLRHAGKLSETSEE